MITLVLAVLLAFATMVLPQATPAQAAGCSVSWHFIKASQLGRNVKPDTGGILYAGGGSDFWNQQFLFCSVTGTDRYAIYANADASYWSSNRGLFYPYVSDRASSVTDNYNVYVVAKFDAKFWTIWSVGLQTYLYTDAGSGYLRDDRGSFLGGDNLFEISPGNLLG